MNCLQKKVLTYARICCDAQPHKSEKHRTCATVGGNRLQHAGDTATPTASATTMKFYLNSTISTPKARYCTLDTTDFYLNFTLPEPEHIAIELHLMLNDFIEQCNLQSIVKNRRVLAKTWKGMHGLKQAGKIAHSGLKKHLQPHGYDPTPCTPGLWKHNKSRLTFTLIVDDFGIKCTSIEQVEHLI